jgi:hypothetical protein
MKGSAVRREYERERAMRGRAQTILPGLTAILGMLSTPSLVAAKPTCLSVAVEADPVVRGRWPELTTDLREALDGRSDLDACALIQVKSVEGSIAVEVSLPDGRSASRHVKHREDVVPTIEALLLLPRASEPAIESPVEAPAPPAARPTLVVDARQVASPAIEAQSSTPPPGAPPSRLRIELSITLSAHVGDGQKAAGVGAMSLLDIAGWLVGFDGRADRYDGTGSAPAPMGALEIGVLGGRRFRSRDLAFDLVAGPALALRGGSGSTVAPVQSGSMMNTVMQSSSREALVPRLRLGGRLTFRARSVVRTFLGVDGEVGDVGPIGPGPLGETHGLPAWTVGLAVGVAVGTL